MKDKKSAILISRSLSDLRYSTDQSASALSQDSSTISEKNTNNIDNSEEKLI